MHSKYGSTENTPPQLPPRQGRRNQPVMRGQDNQGFVFDQGKRETTVNFHGMSFPKSLITDPEDFTIGKNLGRGSFGDVHEGYLNIGSIKM